MESISTRVLAFAHKESSMWDPLNFQSTTVHSQKKNDDFQMLLPDELASIIDDIPDPKWVDFDAIKRGQVCANKIKKKKTKKRCIERCRVFFFFYLLFSYKLCTRKNSVSALCVCVYINRPCIRTTQDTW